MTAEEKKALGSSNSASGDAELVSGVFATVNGESLESKSRALEEEPNRNAEVQIHAEVLRIKAEETEALVLRMQYRGLGRLWGQVDERATQ